MMDEAIGGGANTDQAAYWNGEVGAKWVEFRDRFDIASRQATALLLARAAPRPDEAVLDVGCGAGASTRALAAAAAPGGRVTGIDISAVLLEAARGAGGGPGIEYRLADAQTATWAGPGYDLVASRFGVMFFADPVAAFRNLLGALRPGGRAVLVAWAEAAANPWFVIAREAAVARLGAPPPEPEGGPGPFGLADRARGLGILERAGFAECRVSVEKPDFVQEGGLAGASAFAVAVGPGARLIRTKGGTAEDAAAIAAAVAERLEPYLRPDGSVRVPSTVNVFEAVRPG
jgi:SAM-dependent methyltransferase